MAVPFRTAKASRTHKQTIWVKICHDGIEGWGEAVPMDTYGQTLTSATSTIEAIRPYAEEWANPYERVSSTWGLVARFPDQLATIAAIDVAMYDWMGKKLGISVSDLLGVPRKGHPGTSYSIGIDEPAQMADLARQHLDFPAFKLKVGNDQDAEALAAIRNVAPNHKIRIDGNCGWTLETAIPALKELSEFGIELVEQPLAVDAPVEDWQQLREAVDIPLMADESCVILQDVAHAAKFVDSINIKMGKCGGLTPALAMIQAAKAHGLGIMIGCMQESALSIAAAAQLGAMVDYLDLDGHVLLKDPIFSGLEMNQGVLELPSGPGLGLRAPTPA